MRVKIPLSKVFAGELQLDRAIEPRPSSAESCRRIERRCTCEQFGDRLAKLQDQLTGLVEAVADLAKTVGAAKTQQGELDERVTSLLSKIKRRPKSEEAGPAPSNCGFGPSYPLSNYAPSAYTTCGAATPCCSPGATGYAPAAAFSPAAAGGYSPAAWYGETPVTFDETARRIPTFTRTVHSNWTP